MEGFFLESIMMKMKKILNMISVSVLGVSFAVAQGGGDGEKGPKGARPSAEEVFEKLDEDKDGFLSYDEFKLPERKGPKGGLGKGRKAGKGGQKGAGKEEMTPEEKKEKRFKKLDTNSDEKISLEELKEGRRKGPKKPQPAE